MLPKVATTLLHSSSRAASAVQNQSTAIRNVLQLQSNSGPNSNRGGNGPSSGGFRYSAGSSKGYHSSGRAVSQAGLYEANDGGLFQPDDNDDYSVSEHSTRSRRHSTSLTIAERHEQRRDAASLGVLTAVKLHARSRQAFSTQSPVKASSRRNSLSAVDSPVADLSVDDAALLAQSPSPVPEAVQSLPQLGDDDKLSYHYSQLVHARSLDAHQAAAVVADFRDNAQYPTVPEFNAALDALYYSRPAGEPITLILETYNDMIARGLAPNLRTYMTLILALTDRDAEVCWAEKAIRQREIWVQNGLKDMYNQDDVEQLKHYREENNIGSALALFRLLAGLKSGARSSIPIIVYRNLLKSCALHATEPGVVESAVQVWTLMERLSPANVPAMAFLSMITIYGQRKDVSLVGEIFREFRRACANGHIVWGEMTYASITQTLVWDATISAYFACGESHLAVELLEEMLGASVGKHPLQEDLLRPNIYKPKFDPIGIPSPSQATLLAVVSGFLNAGDLDTAWVWFKKLIDLPYSPSGLEVKQPTLQTTRPSSPLWRIVIEGLALRKDAERLNQLILEYGHLIKKDNIRIRGVELQYAYNTIVGHLKQLGALHGMLPAELVQPSLDALRVLLDTFGYKPANGDDLDDLALWLVEHGYAEEGVAIFERNNVPRASPWTRRDQIITLTTLAFKELGEKLPFNVVLQLARLAEIVRYTYPVDFTALQLQIYSQQPPHVLKALEASEWAVFLNAAYCLEIMPTSVPPSLCPNYTFKGAWSLLEDMAQNSRSEYNLVTLVGKAVPMHMGSLLNLFVQREGEEVVRERLAALKLPSLLDEFAAVRSETASEGASSIFDADSVSGSVASSPVIPSGETIWRFASASEVQELVSMMRYSTNDTTHLFNYFCVLAERRKLPPFLVAKNLIVRLARFGRINDVVHVYDAMMNKIPHPDSNGVHSYRMFIDAMIPCYAQLRQLDRAHELRQILLDQGSAPSADAYGALIYNVNETTDDATNALALYHESRLRGVLGSPYLYNNIISKVAKARKADLALEIFTTMKAEGVQTSSITYGAVIGACVRVGDAASAEVLFEEMTQQPNFHPRIPPYNTMMQLYTTTKPNKQRALYYYGELQKAKIEPSGYTYKLLIDAYMLDGDDLAKVEDIYTQLCRKDKGHPKKPMLEGNHVAAMLNAYGCVRKDLDAAMKFFDSAIDNIAGGPDAVVFEAMFNVVTVHRRADLIVDYLQKMEQTGVRMTAYVVNIIIRAFAVAGDITQARDIFESLQDPPQGQAALYNHAPHNRSDAKQVDRDAPVYREPSTWEAMVRAELGQGHRDRATDLLARLKERQYPDAVFNRISGIMVDHSSLPP